MLFGPKFVRFAFYPVLKVVSFFNGSFRIYDAEQSTNTKTFYLGNREMQMLDSKWTIGCRYNKNISILVKIGSKQNSG